MADVERQLISSMLVEQDFTPITDYGVTPKIFLDKKNRTVFRRLLEFQAEEGSVTIGMMRAQFPEYKFIRVDEPISYLIKTVKENYAYSKTEDALRDAAERFDIGDDAGARRALTELLSEIAMDTAITRDTNLRETVDQRLEGYWENQDRDPNELLGIPTGFTLIDRATQGLQPQQLVTLVGPPKAGKSISLAIMGLAAWRKNKKVLFIGFEMSNEEQEARLDGVLSGVHYKKLLGGADTRLTTRERERVADYMEAFKEHEDFVLSNDTQSTMTVSGIAAKIDKYKPDVVIVDGVYMMHDEDGSPHAPGSPQALTAITRGFKRLAQNKRIPIVITTQVLEWKMDRGRISSGSIGYSSSFIQDSDVVIGVERLQEENSENYRKLKVVLGRSVPAGVEQYVEWDWELGKFDELPGNPFEDDDETDTSF